jgi:hypothetical protein
VNNDECSSGGTNPMPARNLESELKTIVEIAIWIEEAICNQIGDFKSANYKTLVRRVSQNIRSKDDFKTNTL